MSGDIIDYRNGIYAIDSGYVRARLAAIHLIVSEGRAAFVDTATQTSLPHALKALETLGLSPISIDYVILTHIHLDHAGGAGAMMPLFPNAKLVVHPRGAPHMVDPSKLMAGVEAVYGQENARRMYGELRPIPKERIIAAPDNFEFQLGARSLLCIDTPGHARHHMAILDRESRGLFTGDTFGIAYHETNGAQRPFILPTTTPSQFDPEAMRSSILRMLTLQPEALYLTHFGQVGPPQALGDDLLRRIDAFVEIARRSKDAVDIPAAIEQALSAYIVAEAHADGCALSDQAILDVWAGDIELNAQGLALWACA
jgi:glyoxylase-like metal-dependent hydrolase (beta-lactamase superfamily II)